MVHVSVLSISNMPRSGESVHLNIWVCGYLKILSGLSILNSSLGRPLNKQARPIYRRCYPDSNSESLKQLYLSQVRPHLEYARGSSFVGCSL